MLDGLRVLGSAAGEDTTPLMSAGALIFPEFSRLDSLSFPTTTFAATVADYLWCT